MIKRIVEQTKDGFNTLYIPEMDEHYHSVKGAYTESKYIFIDMGFSHSCVASPCILEIGFGTGLNAFLTAIEADKMKRKVIYHTLELYPLERELVSTLGYGKLVGEGYEHLFQAIHEAEWGREVEITPYFTIIKNACDFTQVGQWNDGRLYDVVYFDAFAPEKQPEMWNSSLFNVLASVMPSGSIIVTYCAKGCVRRDFQSCGFMVERLPGPPGGKREILRATKI